jgi:hypothetical protein
MSAVYVAVLVVVAVGVLLAAALGQRRRDAGGPMPPELRAPAERGEIRAEFPAMHWETRRLNGAAEGGRFSGWGRRGRGGGRLALYESGLRFRRGFLSFCRFGSLPCGSFWLPYSAVRRVDVVFSRRPQIVDKMALELDWDAGGRRLRSIFVLAGGVSASVHVARWIEARQSAKDEV